MNTHRMIKNRTVALCIVAILAAACGASASTTSGVPENLPTQSDTQTPTDGPTQPPLTKRSFRVGIIGFGTDASILAASEQGFFVDEGLDVQLELARSGSPMVTAVTGGSLDFGFQGITPALLAINQGAPIKVLANLVTSHDLSLQIRKQVAEDVGIPAQGATLGEQIAALAGSGISIGVGGPGGGVHAQTVAVLLSHGVDVDRDVQIIHYETPDSLVTAFGQNEIDSYAWVSPHSLAVADDDVLRLVFGDLPGYEGSVQWPVIARESLLTEHPASVDAFMRALLRGWLYTRENPDEVGQSFRARYAAELDQQAWDTMWQRMVSNMDPTPAVTRDGLDKTITIVNAGATAPLSVGFADVVDNSFMNRAIGVLNADIPAGN
jgi:NitT/TauT family transport system substrate-binding protein